MESFGTCGSSSVFFVLGVVVGDGLGPKIRELSPESVREPRKLRSRSSARGRQSGCSSATPRSHHPPTLLGEQLSGNLVAVLCNASRYPRPRLSLCVSATTTSSLNVTTYRISHPRDMSVYESETLFRSLPTLRIWGSNHFTTFVLSRHHWSSSGGV